MNTLTPTKLNAQALKTYSFSANFCVGIVGQTAPALLVAETLRPLGARTHTAHNLAGLNLSKHNINLVFSLTEGITPAFTEAMATLAQGIGWCTGNPLVLLAHAEVLQNAAAASGAYLGTHAAGWASPLPHGQCATLICAGGANAVLARMDYRQETFATAEATLKNSYTNFSGKTEHARAIATYLNLFTGSTAKHQLHSINHLTPEHMRLLRSSGFMPRLISQITPHGVSTGLGVVAEGSVLANTNTDILATEHAIQLHSADAQTRTNTGFLTSAMHYLSRAKPVPMAYQTPAQTPTLLLGRHADVRAAFTTSPIFERAGEGLLLALTQTPPPTSAANQTTANLLTIPLIGAYSPPTSLRAVA